MRSYIVLKKGLLRRLQQTLFIISRFTSILRVNLIVLSSLVQTGRVVPVAHERSESGMDLRSKF